MKHLITTITAIGIASLVVAAKAPAATVDPWAGYLDYAFVYSSAESEALRARLAEYSMETGQDLKDYSASSREREAVLRRFSSRRFMCPPLTSRPGPTALQLARPLRRGAC